MLSAVSGGDIDSLNAVLLDTTFKVFSTTLETTVSTVGVETFTVNDSSFNAQNALTIATESGNAFLTNGKVKLEENATINTRRTTDSTTISETITTTSGSLTVEVSNTANTVTIGDLNSGESFTYGNSTYTMSSIGLVTGNTLNPNAATNNSITTAKLVGDDAWKTMWQTTDGTLTISSAVSAQAYAVYFDEDNPSTAINYGTLTKTDGVYSFAQTTAPSSITVEGVKVELPSECGQIPLTAKDATFTVTADGEFTIDATSTLPSISGVSAVTLTSGTLPATTDIPITALGNVITRTAGDGLTVTVDGSAVTVGSLNTGDKFTVGTASYEMTAAGLLDTTNQKLLADVTTS
ncbi:MAG: hypothetical protein IJG24_06175, partial [Selenomonadaceae bacterium]|nr:hypothetical protein [Selenomonadaceae bacterium]